MKTADGKADSPGTHIILCHAESRAKCRDGSWENNNGFVCEEGLEGRVRSERELIGIFFLFADPRFLMSSRPPEPIRSCRGSPSDVRALGDLLG